MIKLKKFPEIELTHERLSIKIRESNLFFNTSKILFPKHALINYFNFKNWVTKKRTGKLFELIFFGLNYNAKRIKHFRKPWVLDLQKSHKIKVLETRTSELKSKIYKRRVLFFSYNREQLTSLVSLLKINRPQNSYSGHGLIARTDKYARKPGKIRQK